MKCLLVGAGGMLASALRAATPSHVRLTALARAQLDVTDRSAVEKSCELIAPDYILNCAAFSAVDAAEERTAEATAINGTAPGVLASIAANRAIGLLHVSTDYVFDGEQDRPYREDDPPNPINAYGRGKLEGERRVIDSGARALLVRVQWLFGHAPHSFGLRMLQRALSGQETRVVDDEIGRPTSVTDAAAAIWRLIQRDAVGTFHVANSGTASRYEEALAIFARVGAQHLVRPCRKSDFPTAAPRPRYTVLDTSKAERLLGDALPPWRDSLDRFLEDALSRAGGRSG